MTSDTDIDEWIEWLLDDPTARCLPTNIVSVDQLAGAGFFRHPDDESPDHESGWHPGQTDDPREILARVNVEYPDHDVIFVLTESSQFYIRFATYIRPSDWEPAPEPQRYYYDDETGMEYWHDGDNYRTQCHDGVGLVTGHYQTLSAFMDMFPNADVVDAS